VIGSNCSAGYVRLDSPGTQWTSQAGGFCAFQGWQNPSNPHDCRANILAHTGGGFFGGSCLSWVYEQQQGLLGFSASNTSSAQANTTNQTITLNAGQTLTIGTCGVPDGWFTGDTYLRLRDPAGNQVAVNDDNCSGLGSQIVFVAPAGGNYEVRVGCYSSSSCNGTLAWTIH
jgi:hypothetical protein